MKNHQKQWQITAFFGEIKGAFYNPSGLTVGRDTVECLSWD